MVYGIKNFLKIDKYFTTMTCIIQFSLSDALKHEVLNVFVEIQIASYKLRYSLQ